MLFKIILLYMFFVFLLSMFKRRREVFTNQLKQKFFILQSPDTSYDIATMPNNIVVGYINSTDIELFKKIYRMHTNNTKTIEFIFRKLDEPDLSDVDVLLYVNDAVYLQNYKIIDYFVEDTVLKERFLKEYEFVLHNDINYSLFVISNPYGYGVYEEESAVPVLAPLEQISDKYNFVIENGIQGKYYETDLYTNEVILYQNRIANLEVRVGDTVLLSKQRHAFMNGEYVVTKVNKYIRMRRENIELLPKHEVCIDENLTEHNEYINKQSCEFENDYVGNPKGVKMTWDARCRRNMECPFFDMNGEYDGKCGSGGYCEMPYDVKQVSFTKYEE